MQFQIGEKKTQEWHYYIFSCLLTALELLHHALIEWSVESMHLLLDVHLDEDFLPASNKTNQENINLL